MPAIQIRYSNHSSTLLYIRELFGVGIEVYFILLFIAVPTFFFWKWLLKRFTRVEGARRIVTWAATLAATPLIYFGLIMLLMFGMTYTPDNDFDKTQWQAEREGRFQMAEDLIESKVLIGKDSSGVKQLLGEPAGRSNPTYQTELKNSWFYDMGMGGGGLGFMFHNLIVKFDSSDKVVAVEHAKIRD